jgi:hypothetical protein
LVYPITLIICTLEVAGHTNNLSAPLQALDARVHFTDPKPTRLIGRGSHIVFINAPITVLVNAVTSLIDRVVLIRADAHDPSLYAELLGGWLAGPFTTLLNLSYKALI